MMNYRQVIVDYFYEFADSFRHKGAWKELSVMTALGLLWGNSIVATNALSVLAGIPVFFALMSGMLHRVSLPFMMFLVPCSAQQRESYIRKMLHVKIAVPMALGLVWNLAELCLVPGSGYLFALEMVSIFFITSLCGMLGEAATGEAEHIRAYGEMRHFVAVPLLFCYLWGTAMYMISMRPVSKAEFWAILSVMLCLMLPMTIAAGRRWRQICKNFADYEMAAE